MADPQNTLGDLLSKFGISMGDSESQRQDMIRRLKTVKDPEERDRLIWSLAGQKKEATGYRPSRGASGRQPKAEKRLEKRPAPTSVSPVPSAAPSPGVPPATESGQQMRIGNIVNYLVPILFVFFGVSNIAKAVEAFRAGAEKEEVFVQFLIGTGFIVFALGSLFSRKMKKAVEKSKGRT